MMHSDRETGPLPGQSTGLIAANARWLEGGYFLFEASVAFAA